MKLTAYPDFVVSDSTVNDPPIGLELRDVLGRLRQAKRVPINNREDTKAISDDDSA